MTAGTIKTSITIDRELLPVARRKAKEQGQSLSSYLTVLTRRDLAQTQKPKAKAKKA